MDDEEQDGEQDEKSLHEPSTFDETRWLKPRLTGINFNDRTT
jgi:hypothetical protein